MKSLPELAAYDDCTGCMLCADTCPKGAIRFQIDENGFWLPRVDTERCIGCKLCEKSCRTVRSNELHPFCEQPYKGHAVSDDVRRRSTSGGIFYALAEHAIRSRQAVVFGAVCEGGSIRHRAVETIEELAALQGSKYAQSDTRGVYQQVKRLLKEGRFVLFSGTPCQVQALHTYLGKTQENLLTIDLICHGVPSYKLMERHLAVNKGDTILQFRAKAYGWGHDSYVTIRKQGQEITVTDRFNNIFYQMFQTELAFRPNCYKCRFNGVNRAGDISIGDYWHVRTSAEYDALGISTILPNTDKGAAFLRECLNICKEPISWEQALDRNPRLVTDRREYLRTALSHSIGKLYRYLPAWLADRLLGTLRSKRRPFSLLWLMHLARKRAGYQERYQQALDERLRELTGTRKPQA